MTPNWLGFGQPRAVASHVGDSATPASTEVGPTLLQGGGLEIIKGAADLPAMATNPFRLMMMMMIMMIMNNDKNED